jgi:hypothetical protein
MTVKVVLYDSKYAWNELRVNLNINNEMIPSITKYNAICVPKYTRPQ